MKIQVLVDNKNSWSAPFAKKLATLLTQKGHSATFIQSHDEIQSGDALFLISCEKILTSKYRQLNRHNLVIHAGDLPLGRGWSPVTWQILEGKNEIIISLLEAVDSVDAGPVYFKDTLKFQGHELVDEIREIQGNKTNELALRFVDEYSRLQPKEQVGEATFYPKRRPVDSQLDLKKTLEEQFNLLRVCDNDQYPAYIEHLGHKYLIKIVKATKT